MKLTLRAPLPDARAWSAIGAAIALIAALEALPGVDHRSTAIGLTAALVLIGTSVTAGLASDRRRRWDEWTVGRRQCSPGNAFVATLVGFSCAALCGLVVSMFKSAWILDAKSLVAGVLLGSAFAAALGALLGLTAHARHELNHRSLMTFCVLLAPVAMGCGDNLPGPVCRVVRWWPTVALNDLLFAAFAKQSDGSTAVSAAIELLLAISLILAVAFRFAPRWQVKLTS